MALHGQPGGFEGLRAVRELLLPDHEAAVKARRLRKCQG